MQKVTIVFSTHEGIFSKLICLATWSKWSHVGLLVNDTHVVDSTFKHNGVQIRKLEDALDKTENHAFVDFYVPDSKSVIDAAISQVGKPYDWSAVIGIYFKRVWQEEDSWFCSELVTYAFQKAGFPLFREETMHRIVPDNLWRINPLLTNNWQKD